MATAVQQAIAREALRLAFFQHRELAVGLKGVQTERTLSDVFDQNDEGDEKESIRYMHNQALGKEGDQANMPRIDRRSLQVLGDDTRRGQSFFLELVR